MPKRVTEKGREWIGIAIRALKRFFKAYLSLLGITFLALAVGYFIVGVDYPLLAALLTSLVDILPVFGVGTVLLPWSAVMLVSGETGKGIGLAVLFLIIYAMRQVIEPRIVGKNAGVHPLLVLLFVFLGLQLFGVVGMIAAPVLLNGAAVFWEEKKKNSPAEVDKEEGSGYNYIE